MSSRWHCPSAAAGRGTTDLAMGQHFEDYAPIVLLASVGIYETVGPISARFVLVRAGKARMHLGHADAQAKPQV